MIRRGAFARVMNDTSDTGWEICNFKGYRGTVLLRSRFRFAIQLLVAGPSTAAVV